MRRRNLVSGVVFAFLAISLATPPAPAGSITGIVRDRGKPPPNGISGVSVQVRSTDGKVLDIQAITDADGEFTLREVPDGDYTIVLNKVGYIPRPAESRKLKIEGQGKVGEIKLMRAYLAADSAADYYGMIAADIARTASSGPDTVQRKKKVYVEEWRRLRAISLPPSSKAYLAAGLVKRDEEALRYVPEIKAYLEAKPEDIRKAETRFEMALVGKMSLPPREEANHLNVGPEIIADIVLMQARNGSVSEEKRMALVREFLASWEDTDAARVFAGYQKEGLEKIPTLPPFEK
jgi:hypothetical protein